MHLYIYIYIYILVHASSNGLSVRRRRALDSLVPFLPEEEFLATDIGCVLENFYIRKNASRFSFMHKVKGAQFARVGIYNYKPDGL